MSDTSLVFNLVARDRASGEVGAIGEKFNTAAAGIGVGFAALLGASVMQNMDMEAAGDKLAAQLGLGPAEAAQVAEVSASVYENAWGESVDEVNLAIKGVYQNIGDTSQAEGGLEGITTKALALASTFDQDLTMATAAAGQMIRTGLADNADEAFDILTKGLQGSADKAGDLLETFNEYSTQFRRIGLDGQTATGLLSQGLKAGAKDADQVADAIGQFGELTLAGGTAVDAAFKSIGLSSTDMAKKIGAGGSTAEAALGLTLDKLRGTKNEQTKLNAATALFGDPGTVMGNALFALDPATAAASAGMDKTAGAADKMVKSVGDNPKAALESFKRTVMTELGQAAGGIAGFAMDNMGATKGLVGALTAVAGIILLVSAAQKVYATYTAIATTAQALQNSTAFLAIGGWTRMMAVGLMAYARIAIGAVASATTTAAAWVGSALVSIGTWIAAVVRAGLTAAGQFLMMAARAVVWAAVMAAQWLIAMGPIGWITAAVIALVVLIILNWDKIAAATGAVWTWIWGKIKWAGQMILAVFLNFTLPGLLIKHWSKIRSGAVAGWNAVVGFIRTMPGKISGALGNLGSLLFGKGQDVVRGLLRGVLSMGGWLRSQLMSFAKAAVPGPIAKALGIGSPSKVLADEVGQWIPPGIVEGAESKQGMLDQAMAGLVQVPSSSAAQAMGRQMGPGAAPLMAGGGGRAQADIRIEIAGPAEVRKLIRGIVRKDGGGNVQLAFGGL
ncbi:phage tail tape measure protein [Streptomyces sp. AcH 505]|uniref:phage tail tape measure protein n=1 Tax=Streptomyces sp. AcH 505 TaxID=352211 RepID=UPI00069486D1